MQLVNLVSLIFNLRVGSKINKDVPVKNHAYFRILTIAPG